MAERTSCFDQLTVIYKAQGMTRALFGSGHPLSGLFWHWLTNSSCREVSTPHKVLEFKDSFRRLLNGRELHFYSSCSGRWNESGLKTESGKRKRYSSVGQLIRNKQVWNRVLWPDWFPGSTPPEITKSGIFPETLPWKWRTLTGFKTLTE